MKCQATKASPSRSAMDNEAMTDTSSEEDGEDNEECLPDELKSKRKPRTFLPVSAKRKPRTKDEKKPAQVFPKHLKDHTGEIPLCNIRMALMRIGANVTTLALVS